MRVCFVNAVCDEGVVSPDNVLKKYWHLVKLARAIASRGSSVLIVQAFSCDGAFEFDGIAIRLIRSGRKVRFGNHLMREMAPAKSLSAALDGFGPDVIHLFGLTLDRPIDYLLSWAAQNQCPVTASYHGGVPYRNPIRRKLQKNRLRQLSAVMFSAGEHALPWQKAGCLDPNTIVSIVNEVSSPFHGVDRDSARAQLGLHGKPIIVWPGRLNKVKDPMTALRGFLRVLDKWPEALLLMVCRTDKLWPDIESFLRAHDKAARRIQLLDEQPHGQMEWLFSAADIVLLSSLREIGSNSLVEAMSCGAVPVVTNIPAFEFLTRDVPAARLFPCGDEVRLARAIDEVANQDIGVLGAEVKSCFVDHLSYTKLATRYAEIFELAVGARTADIAH